MLLDLKLKYLCDGLICTWEEVVRQEDLLTVCKLWVVVDCWIQIEKHRQIK